MLFFSWLFYIWFLGKLVVKIDFERDTCLMVGINFGILILLIIFYSILSLWGLLNISFYQVLREYGMKMLFTLYSMLLTATLTLTSILFTLGNWVISRRDGEDGRLIAVVRFTRMVLLLIFVVIFFFLLLTADLLVMRQIILVAFFLAESLSLTITMAQILVLMHALMDTLSEPAKPKGETKGPEHKVGDGAKVEGVKEGTGGTSKSQS
jgi:glucan phosphoethanolaminetransferase (alkaline phosphatase superfamily)